MAEDEEFVATIEEAGLKFIGPNSVTQARAGKKDEAKRTALEVKVSRHPRRQQRHRAHARSPSTRPARRSLALVKAEGPRAATRRCSANAKLPLEDLADHVLMASYAKGIDLYTIDELGEQVAARGRRDVQEVPAAAGCA